MLTWVPDTGQHTVPELSYPFPENVDPILVILLKLQPCPSQFTAQAQSKSLNILWYVWYHIAQSSKCEHKEFVRKWIQEDNFRWSFNKNTFNLIYLVSASCLLSGAD